VTDAWGDPQKERQGDQDRDLAGRAMAAIDQLVDTVHDRFIRPVLLIGRTIAFSFIIVFAAIVIAVGLGVALMRLLDVYLFSGHEWASWALLGLVSLAAGLVIWRKRRAVPSRSEGAR
jgi:hypothetical protein